MSSKVQHNKGKIRDNALKALVKSDLFRHKVERKEKARVAIIGKKPKNGGMVLILSRHFLYFKRGSSHHSRKSL